MEDSLGALVISIMAAIVILTIVSSFVFVIVKTVLRARARELEIKERIALIERGLVPPPEVDPGGFDRAMARQTLLEADRERLRRGGRGPGRHRRAGITAI